MLSEANRGVLDTIPQPHVIDDVLFFIDEFGETDETEYQTAETVGVKLTPVTGKGTLAIENATADLVTFNQRQYRPLPPGNVTINGVHFPTAVVNEITIAWAHRDRLQQSAGLIPWITGNIGPELGTTYELKIYNDVGTLIRTETGLTSTSFFYSFADETADDGKINNQLTFELYSVRDGMQSLQSFSHMFSRTTT